MKFHIHRYVLIRKWDDSPHTETAIRRCRCLRSKITRTWIVDTH